jgi:magnesium transporter
MAVRARAKKGSPPEPRKLFAERQGTTGAAGIAGAETAEAAALQPDVPARRRHTFKRYHKPGTAPGTLRPVEDQRVERARVTVIHYNAEKLEELEISDPAECEPFSERRGVTWINVEGLTDIGLIESLGKTFGLHPLSLEDVLNCGQRPKVEEYDDYQFVIMRSLRLDGEQLEGEQISLFFGRNFVLTFQEVPGDSFEAVRARIRSGKGLIRKAGPDYLAYALIDALVDEFFPVLEHLGERVEALEDELVDQPSPDLLRRIHAVKRELLALRRAAWPERDLLNALLREDSELIHPGTKVFLRDPYDHIVQAMDMIETFRELASGMIDVYLSSLSNRMNEVMKVLTVISTIFIPLTFIAGIYGMNFHPNSPWNMPELEWYYGYPFSLALMLAVALSLVYYFRRKGWF